MADKLGQTICDPLGHPWICCVPDPYVQEELEVLKKKIFRQDLKVRRTTHKDMREVPMWDYEKYIARNKKP